MGLTPVGLGPSGAAGGRRPSWCRRGGPACWASGRPVGGPPGGAGPVGGGLDREAELPSGADGNGGGYASPARRGTPRGEARGQGGGEDGADPPGSRRIRGGGERRRR